MAAGDQVPGGGRRAGATGGGGRARQVWRVVPGSGPAAVMSGDGVVVGQVRMGGAWQAGGGGAVRRRWMAAAGCVAVVRAGDGDGRLMALAGPGGLIGGRLAGERVSGRRWRAGGRGGAGAGWLAMATMTMVGDVRGCGRRGALAEWRRPGGGDGGLWRAMVAWRAMAAMAGGWRQAWRRRWLVVRARLVRPGRRQSDTAAMGRPDDRVGWWRNAVGGVNGGWLKLFAQQRPWSWAWSNCGYE